MTGEVKWRDMEGQGFARSADALLKLKEIEIPRKGLWRRVPGVTSTELAEWELLVEEEPSQIIASSMRQAESVRGQQGEDLTPDPQLEDGDLEA